MEIELKKIKPNKYNPREIFRGAAMEELKESLKDVGLIHPILIRPLKNGEFEVVAGMRRYYAAIDLKWDSIECYSRELKDLDAIKIAFSENIKREDLNPIELGRMYRTYMEYLPSNGTKNKKSFSKSESKLLEEIANEFNLSNVTIRNYVSLLILPSEIQSLIIMNQADRNKGFPVSYGFELARLPEEDIMNFYNSYNPKDYSIDQYKKKISDKIDQNKLAGEKKKAQLEGNLNRARLELEKFIQKKEAFEDRINKNLEKLDGKYIIKEAIKFLDDQLKEFQSREKLDGLAKKMKEAEHQINDLSILLERTEKEHISICPYCLAKIDLSIINKRKDLFKTNLKELNSELKEINATMESSRKLRSDLVDDNELLEEILTKIKQKENEVKVIKNEFE